MSTPKFKVGDVVRCTRGGRYHGNVVVTGHVYVVVAQRGASCLHSGRYVDVKEPVTGNIYTGWAEEKFELESQKKKEASTMQIGDALRCVDNIGREDRLKMGSIYYYRGPSQIDSIVVSETPTGPLLRDGEGFWTSRFEAVNSSNAPKWMPSEATPSKPGIYERLLTTGAIYTKWNGEVWGHSYNDLSAARNEPWRGCGDYQRLPWRPVSAEAKSSGAVQRAASGRLAGALPRRKKLLLST